MERREDLHRHGCSIAKQTILTTHPSGLQTRVSVELANFDALCVHSECTTKPKRPMFEGSPFLTRRGILGGVSAHGTPVLGRRSDAVNEGRLSQQCTPVMRRREVESPGGSPLPARRCEEELETEVDNSVISGWLKFRDNKRMNSTKDYKYYIIELTDELPHPSFPRIICVPKSWIKLTLPSKVAVDLPKEDYSVTASRIRSEVPGDDWCLFWAQVKDKKNDCEIAINNARVYNEALLHEAQQKQGAWITSDNIQNHTAEEAGSQSQDKEVSVKNVGENDIQDLATGEENQSQDEEVSEDNLKKNEQQDIVEAGQHQYQDEERPTDSLESNKPQNLTEEEEKNINQNDLNQIDTNPNENQQNWIEEDISSNGSDESWEPSESDYSEMDSNTSDNPQTTASDSERQIKKINRIKQYKKKNKEAQRKREAAETNNAVKKRKLINTPHSENEVIPSTSHSTVKVRSRRRDMQILDLNYKQLEEDFMRLDDVLEILRTILNKIGELFVDALYNVNVMIDVESMVNTSSLNDNVGLDSGNQIHEKESGKCNDDNEEQKKKQPDEVIENSPIGHYSKSQTLIQPNAENTNKRSKWTLRYEEFKPQTGLVELLPGCGIYVSEKGLQKCKANPNNPPTIVARNLLCEIFSDEALRKCTLSGLKGLKPGLDDYARQQLMTYVKQYCIQNNWDIDEFSISNALRVKLWQCRER